MLRLYQWEKLQSLHMSYQGYLWLHHGISVELADKCRTPMPSHSILSSNSTTVDSISCYDFPESTLFPVTGYNQFILPENLSYINATNLQAKLTFSKINFGKNKLTFLNLSHNCISSWTEPWNGLHKLTTLYISNSGLSRISNNSFGDMSGLLYLDLSHNILGDTIVPQHPASVFKNLTKFNTLNLRHNSLYGLPNDIFTQQIHVEELVLCHNAFINFNVRIRHMTRLRALDLSHNQMSSLQEQICADLDIIASKSPHNVTVNLMSNPIQCSCDQQQFLQWLQTTRVHVLHDNTCVGLDGGQKSLTQIDDVISELRMRCISKYVIYSCVFGFLGMLLILSLVGVIYYNRQRTRVVNAMNRRLLNPIRYPAPNILYDAFVSYGEDQRAFVVHKLYPALLKKGLKLCCIEQNVIGPIATGIESLVSVSTKTIVLLSNEYMQDRECTFAFRTAINVGIEREREAVVVLIMEDLDQRLTAMHEDILLYTRDNPCIQYPGEGQEQLLWEYVAHKVWN